MKFLLPLTAGGLMAIVFFILNPTLTFTQLIIIATCFWTALALMEAYNP